MSDDACFIRTECTIKVMGVPIGHRDLVVLGGPVNLSPCLTCRHWNHVAGTPLGLCTSDAPKDKAKGELYADASARRPCWEAAL